MTTDKKVKILATLGPATDGMAQRGDTLVITAGAPFGQPGSTNSLLIETLI
ncbi:hypothetical protein [Pseudomonas sp.]|uniref:hypothetical protein n=1 Tax=Pseudomonas sp. TaxID=306 RepID=UPI0032676848